MSKKLTLVVISDTHNLHNYLSIPPGDVLIHAGDFTNWGHLENVVHFNDWLGALPHGHKIVVAGNHDFCFERSPQSARALLTNCTYLQDESVTIEGFRFYASPWQPEFCNWAFNLQRGERLKAKWALIPADTDVLITHGPPRGYGDITYGKENVGCEDLLKRVEEIGPKYHIFGHIHEGYGVWQKGSTTFINASSIAESWKEVRVNPPVVLQLGDDQ